MRHLYDPSETQTRSGGCALKSGGAGKWSGSGVLATTQLFLYRGCFPWSANRVKYAYTFSAAYFRIPFEGPEVQHRDEKHDYNRQLLWYLATYVLLRKRYEIIRNHNFLLEYPWLAYIDTEIDKCRYLSNKWATSVYCAGMEETPQFHPGQAARLVKNAQRFPICRPLLKITRMKKFALALHSTASALHRVSILQCGLITSVNVSSVSRLSGSPQRYAKHSQKQYTRG